MEPPASAELSRIERLALQIGHFANHNPIGKSLQAALLRNVSFNWVRRVLWRRTLADGLDGLVELDPPAGVLLVSNHRTFFDQYALLCAAYMGPVHWARRLYFPVRSNFFYDSPAGLLINLAVTGAAMYPPVYREAERRALNDDALDQISAFLQEPGSVVGVHPEGTRGKGPDPYKFLPAQPGVGKMALSARPTVIPLFVNGLSNNFLDDVRRNFDRDSRRTSPVIAVFGKPLDYSAFTTEKPRPTLYKKCADFFMSEIGKLAEVEKRLRRECAEDRIAADDPRWLVNRRHTSPFAAEIG
ncbi:MAG: lysophospholipid acyltransferase family protein [Kofleriaceae bacterium]